MEYIIFSGVLLLNELRFGPSSRSDHGFGGNMPCVLSGSVEARPGDRLEATGLVNALPVEESTMLALIGHMSRAMLERYSHIRMTAKRDAVAGVVLRPTTKNAENSEAVPVEVPVVAKPEVIQ
jgi:hypothetical protein